MMPVWHCSKCHHEWERGDSYPCDWCGAAHPVMLAAESPLEKLLKDGWEKLKSLPDPTPEQLKDIPEVIDWTGAMRGKFSAKKKTGVDR